MCSDTTQSYAGDELIILIITTLYGMTILEGQLPDFWMFAIQPMSETHDAYRTMSVYDI